jgi:hypothetical protein
MYSKIDLSKLYEQQGEETSVESDGAKKQVKAKTALYAFEMHDGILADLTKLAETGGDWKSHEPLKILGKDGSIGGVAYINEKPVYLWINSNKKKKDQTQLELADRVYLLWDTNKVNILNAVSDCEGIENRKRVYVSNSYGTEYSLEIWCTKRTTEEPKKELESDTTEIKVDIDKAVEAPGTAAGISGVVAEGVEYENINESNLKAGGKLELVKKYLGSGKIPVEEVKVSVGTAILAQSEDLKYKAYFYENGRVWMKTKEDKWIKASYKDGGREIIVDNAGYTKGGSVWDNLRNMETGKLTKKANVPSYPSTGFTKAQGDAFRKWANSTPELASKIGKQSKYDLDAVGKHDNSYIRRAYGAVKSEYTNFLASNTKDDTKNIDSKFKVNDIVYYKSEEEAASTTGSETASAGDLEKAYGLAESSIATNLSSYLSLKEQNHNTTSVASQEDLIRDIKDGKYKKAIITKIFSKDKVEVKDLEDESTLKANSNEIIKSDDYKKAKAKSEVIIKDDEKEKDQAAKGDAAKSDFKEKKESLKDSKKKLRDAKKQNRKKKRFSKKSEKVEKRQEKVDKKLKDAANESKVYSFDEFIKSVNELN